MQSPFQLFTQWLDEATAKIAIDPNAMVVASVDAQGRPSARVVLLKGHSEAGFVFYTNFTSRKGEELQHAPHAALCFHWRELQRQVRVEGSVERVSEEEADAYFASRARGSQIGAWASHQSKVIASREELETRVAELDKKYANQRVPRPPFWSGFRVVPTHIEFWTARQSRLHDRLVYERDGAAAPWRTFFLSP